ncbi:MAG: PEP-CTERM sorting domain-containing protein [Phycisphaerales bacterium]|nr:PEP-CTERM sorting domain-containing protein [Phycisphaerales bacterium]
MTIRIQTLRAGVATLGVVAGGVGAHAASITVTVENTMASDGFFLTPFWLAVHNGGFDSYDGGSLAGGFPGLEELAEEGMTAPIAAAFAASGAGAAGGFETTLTADDAPPPVFSPGETATMTYDIGDGSINRYFSYASMVIPSNDFFIANGNPLGHEVFDAAGNFLGPLTIEIRGSMVNDAGTEVNNAAGGAAFSALGGTSVSESLPIANIFSNAGTPGYLSSFVGTQTASGATIGSTFGADDVIARITIIPTPAVASLLVLAGVAGRSRRRRS